MEVCPVKNKKETRLKAINMAPQASLRATEAENWNFFLALPEMDRSVLTPSQVKDVQLFEPLFAVAEQLREQFHIGRLAAPRTGAGELE